MTSQQPEHMRVLPLKNVQEPQVEVFLSMYPPQTTSNLVDTACNRSMMI